MFLTLIFSIYTGCYIIMDAIYFGINSDVFSGRYSSDSQIYFPKSYFTPGLARVPQDFFWRA